MKSQESQEETAQRRSRLYSEAEVPALIRTAGNRSVPPPLVTPRRGHSLVGELAVALLVVAVILACGGTLLGGELWVTGRVVPNLSVWDVDLGGLTRAEALDRLQSSFHYPVDRYPLLRHGSQHWTVRPADLGAHLDLTATVDAAFAVGHDGSLTTRLREQLDALLNGRLVMPVYAADTGTGTMFLSDIAGKVNLSLRNASLTLGDDLSVQIVPSQIGREVDEEATRQALLKRISEMSGGAVDLVVRESQPWLTDLSAAQAQVQRILSAPVVLTAPGFDPWTIDPRTLAGWLVLQPLAGADGQPTLAVSLDSGQVTAFAQGIADQVARSPSDAKFRWDDASGQLVAVVQSVDGQSLDVAQTVSLIENATAGDQRTAALPLTIVRPNLATEDGPSLGITELLSDGTTSFAGSAADRIKNITVGAAQFDGLMVAPGATFSFDESLGEVTEEKGYVPGIIIWGNTTRTDIGGGLCQVATTAFRAAFWAGVPIVERTAHSFRVAYYEPPVGLDATIYAPSVDLKWVNDTGHWILIQTYVDKAKKTVSFRFYGTNPGRTVELEGPYESNPVPHGPAIYRDDPTLPKGQTKQIEFPKDGLDVTCYRVIKVNGVEVQRDTFFSRYLPWQPVYLVGTKEP